MGNHSDSKENLGRFGLRTWRRPVTGALVGYLLAAMGCATSHEHAPRPGAGVFTTSQDIGAADLPGQVTEVAPGRYVVAGAGRNLWGAEDEFHFAFTALIGDAQIGADIDLGSPLGQRYRKALLMFRGSPNPDAAYVDVAVHENGTGALQYRPYEGAPTLTLDSRVHAPHHVRLVRRGTYFHAEFENASGEHDQVGPIAVALPDAALVGLGVNSADTEHLARVTFSNLELSQAVSLALAEEW